MHAKRLFTGLRAVSLVLAAVLFLTSAWAADHQTVLYSFSNHPDAATPVGSLIMDAAGNLYGATNSGGIYCPPFFGCGTVFKLSCAQTGWTETVLYSFGNGNDGVGPTGSLIMDAAGNLYGTTNGGGIHGVGTVFELSPSQDGGWEETVLYSFDSINDGFDPSGGLIMDAAGNLYGATSNGGTYAEGTVFELSPSQGGGGWTETVLYNFGHGTDGAFPVGGLVIDTAGNLYGTTEEGGQGGSYCQSYGCGTVFELSPSGGGWAETVLHNFNGDDGNQPRAGLAADAAGNLYGTTIQGGPYCAPFGCGTVFEVSPSAGAGWTETTLYFFTDQPDGALPDAGVVLDADGNVYGTTSLGGNENAGIAFEVSPRHGGWTETVLYSFDQITSGFEPQSGLIVGRSGGLYGAVWSGGAYDFGLVYELTPPSICAHCVPTEH
jgi:uncharacterized repeat protein (TIGR03803 family)